MHITQQAWAPGEISAAKARAGTACQEKSSAFPTAAELLLWANSSGKQCQKSKDTKAKRVCATIRQHWVCLTKHAGWSGCKARCRGASVLPLQWSRHGHCRARRDWSKHTAPCVTAKGNDSGIKPCRLQSATAAYAKNFRLQIEVMWMFTDSVLNQFLWLIIIQIFSSLNVGV